jgi:Bacterial TSP3 repeat
METRSRTRSMLRGAAVLAALGALSAPATAGAAVKAPVVTKVTPISVSVGQKLIIRGRYFKVGKAKNRVLFRASTGKSLFVTSALSTTKRMTVVVPARLGALLVQRNGAAVATRFRLRVLARRLSKHFTAIKNSPFVAPKPQPVSPGGGAAPVATCPVGTDDDGDGLANALEISIGTNPCAADSDGDGVTDGFEYRSALDLNNGVPSQSLPYPGKRPYPNPLDATDAGTDFDGDGLTLADEYGLWRYTVAHGAGASLDHLTYSDGLKYSETIPAASYPQMLDFEQYLVNTGRTQVTYPDGVTAQLLDTDRNGTIDSTVQGSQLHTETSYLDTHGVSGLPIPDGLLSDDERDEDGDGLSNWVELHGPLLPSWYAGTYNGDHAYTIKYAGTNPTDPDSDGDGVRDGADDQDHDGVPNFDEVSRNMATDLPPSSASVPATWAADGTPTGANTGWVDPYNPCLPFINSATCPTYLPMNGSPWSPFNSDGTLASSFLVKD